jgi:DNA-binding winged helix-turn-helix (wHTH) protein
MENRSRRLFRFGTFEADSATGELRRAGRPVGLQEQPFRLLLALLERPAEAVTRAELREKLWGETHVDFEEGLNTAVRKLREALGDSASNPRFIETLPRRGYRFIAPVESVADPAVAPEGLKPVRERSWWPLLSGGSVVSLLGVAILVLLVLVSRETGMDGILSDATHSRLRHDLRARNLAGRQVTGVHLGPRRTG